MIQAINSVSPVGFGDNKTNPIQTIQNYQASAKKPLGDFTPAQIKQLSQDVFELNNGKVDEKKTIQEILSDLLKKLTPKANKTLCESGGGCG